MTKLLTILGICTVVIGSYGVVWHTATNYQKNKDAAAEYKADNTILMAQARTMVNAYKQTQNALNELRKTPDPSVAPVSIQSTILSLCDRRKASNVPCQSAGPARIGD